MKLMRLIFAAGLLALSPVTQGLEVIMAGGVALRSWEVYRGPSAHDNWWANFIRASTVQMSITKAKKPGERIVWIVFRPAYITRGRENKTAYISRIRETAAKYRAKLVFVDTADAAFAAINKAPRKGEKINSFYYFGHSNPHAFMLDYSNVIIGASTQWMHENDLATKIRRDIFAPDAECWSYGCYTGRSMSAKWKAAFGVPLWGNLGSTRYQPVGEGRLPAGASRWVR
jgi:hypothetical protein